MSKSFELECRPDGIHLLACISNTGIRFPVDGPKENNGYTVVCKETANKTMIFNYTKMIKPSNKFPLKLNRNSNSNLNELNIKKCDDENGNKRSISKFF